MTATHGKAHENTTPAARAAAPAGAANSPAGPAGPGAEAAQPPAAGGGIIAALQRWWPDWTLEGPRKLTINTLIVIAGLLGSGVVVKATLKQVQVVEAISVPKDLESDGYTSAIVAQRLIDAASEITRTAALARRIGAYTLVESEPSRPDSTDSEGPSEAYAMDSAFSLTCDDPGKKYDVQVGGVSLTTVILYVRELFGLADSRISGEITVEHAAPGAGKDDKTGAKRFAMRLRITNKGHVEHEAKATDQLETLFEQAALRLVERFDPLNAAYYSYYKRDFDNARRIVRVYLTDPSPKDDSEWAENLLGLLEYARYRRDDALAEAGLDKAIVQLRKLRQSEPKFAPGLYNLAYVLTDKGRKRQAAGETEAAKTYFNEAHAVARDGIRAHEAQDKTSRGRAVGYATAGRALRQLARWEKGKYDEALHAYEQSIDADRLFIPAYVSQGMIHFKRRDVDKAIAVYQLAAELNPSPQTLTRVGAALRQNGRHKESVPMFEEAAELEPSAKAYTYWGMALRDSDRHAEARAVFAKAIEADPKLANGYNQLGLSYLDEEQWDKAAEQFATAMKLAPQWSNYQYNLGLAQRGAGKLDEAIASFQKTIAIYPSHAWSYAQWGATLAQRERRDSGTVSEETAKRVEEKLKRAVELKPNDKIVLEALREAYETMDWREQAIDAHRRALAIGDGMQGGLNSEIKPIDHPVGGGEF